MKIDRPASRPTMYIYIGAFSFPLAGNTNNSSLSHFRIDLPAAPPCALELGDLGVSGGIGGRVEGLEGEIVRVLGRLCVCVFGSYGGAHACFRMRCHGSSYLSTDKRPMDDQHKEVGSSRRRPTHICTYFFPFLLTGNPSHLCISYIHA